MNPPVRRSRVSSPPPTDLQPSVRRGWSIVAGLATLVLCAVAVWRLVGSSEPSKSSRPLVSGSPTNRQPLSPETAISPHAADNLSRLNDDPDTPEALRARVRFTTSMPPQTTPEGMVWIPGGVFLQGDPDFPDAQPRRWVGVDGFWIDQHEVTNRQYATFVAATGYQTVAERPLDPRDFPGVPPDQLRPGSIVFTPPSGPVPLDNVTRWWTYTPGACWRHPEGPGSTIEGREDHPAVHLAYEDAEAYARWAGKRLPTEAEWEYAARGGLVSQPFVWGAELKPEGSPWLANIWQGHFPNENSREDGFARTAPVKSFPPNGFGLYDMAGNVWEWCADWYHPNAYQFDRRLNPSGPPRLASFDPMEPGVPKRVQRGGSFLCTDQYCTRYRPGARGKGEPGSAASHVGFRCARSVE